MTWGPPEEGEGRRKRQQELPVTRPELTVTQYTVVVGEEEILEPYDPIPLSSVMRVINVRILGDSEMKLECIKL